MILLRKLGAYEIRGTPLNWFQSYLSNRKLYVELDGVKDVRAKIFQHCFFSETFTTVR